MKKIFLAEFRISRSSDRNENFLRTVCSVEIEINFLGRAAVLLIVKFVDYPVGELVVDIAVASDSAVLSVRISNTVPDEKTCDTLIVDETIAVERIYGNHVIRNALAGDSPVFLVADFFRTFTSY